jgi:hypothetical protein
MAYDIFAQFVIAGDETAIVGNDEPSTRHSRRDIDHFLANLRLPFVILLWQLGASGYSPHFR